MSKVLDETDGGQAQVELAAPVARPGTARLAAAGGRWLRRRALTVLSVLFAGTALFVLYLHLARTLGLNADGAGQALQAQDMLHGNLMLSQWSVSDVSFWLTELPEYMLVEAVHGLNGDVVHVAAALTYTLAVLLAAWLAKGRATGFEAYARMLVVLVVMLAPVAQATTLVVLDSPDHFGTAVPLLVIFLAVDRLPQRRYTPAVLFLLIAWAGTSDSTATLVGGGSIALLSALRLWRGEGRPRYEAAVLGAAVLAMGVASELPKIVNGLGGFLLHPPNVNFNQTDQMSSALWSAVDSFATLFSANFFGLPVMGVNPSPGHGPTETALALLHLVGAAMVVWALAATVRRLRQPEPAESDSESESEPELAGEGGDERAGTGTGGAAGGDLVARMLAVGVVLNLAAFALTSEIGGGAREIASVLPLGAALAGRVVGSRLAPDYRPVAMLSGLALVLVGVLAQHGSNPESLAASHGAEAWLKDNGYTYGLGGYWSSNNITADSGGSVKVRPVASAPVVGIQEYDWESKSTWYDPARNYANFLVVDTSPGAAAYATPEQAVKQFGPPVKTITVPFHEILIYDKNLLAGLPHPQRP